MERNNRLIEPERIRSRFTHALESYDRHAIAQQQIIIRATELLSEHLCHFSRCLEIGCGTGGFTRQLQKLLPHAAWTLNDLCEASLPLAVAHCPYPPQLIPGDAEQAELGTDYDLIASSSAFQWFHDLVGFAAKLTRMQNKGGLLLFTTFAPGNLKEIKEITGKGLIYPTANDWQSLLTPSYNIMECREEEIKLTFHSPLDVLRHLKQTGVTATASGPWTRGMQTNFVCRYNERYSTDNNQVTLTYCPLYVLAVRL